MAKWIRIFLISMIVCLNFHQAGAQIEDFVVQIVYPGEGETIYAGPSSLLFSIPVSGYVHHSNYNFDQISIHLEVIKDGKIIGSLDEKLTHFNTFDFYLTANEEATDDEFDPMHASCIDYCHVRSQLSLPTGNVLLKVIAKAPNGNTVSTERKIIVDHSNYMDVPVHVVFDDVNTRPVPNIPIKASTWLYMWRSRSAAGVTDDQGDALVKVEVLSEVPTHWVFSIPPVTIDGIRYESKESVALTLNPGMTTIPQILLNVVSHRGSISGRLIENKNQEVVLKAVRLSTGDISETITSNNGDFVFSDMLIDRYVLLVGSGIKQENTLVYPQFADLTIDPNININLPVFHYKGRSLHGQVIDEHDLPIPFAWITIDNSNYVQSVSVASGEFSLLGLTGERLNFQIRSPGYFSQEITLSLEEAINFIYEEKLKPQERTRYLSWGDGWVTLPAETELDVEDNTINLKKGWVWGRGKGSTVKIQSASKEIRMENAGFAYELLPGRSEWLFIFDGSAELFDGSDLIIVNAGQMVNLLQKPTIIIPYDQALLSAMRSDEPVPVSMLYERSMSKKISDKVHSIGLDIAQFIVYFVYFAVLVALIFMPSKLFIKWLRKKKSTY